MSEAKKTTIELCYDDGLNPFARSPLVIVDYGVSDNIYVVESVLVSVLLAERDRLRAENAELLAACQAMINEYTQYETLADTEILGRAAIKNATRKDGQ